MTKKLTDEQFWPILERNDGLFHYTAKDIEESLGISYTRQAVQNRAAKDPERLQSIKEKSLDKAERNLDRFMDSGEDRVALDATKFYLKTIGKPRGYVEKTEVDNTHTFPDKIELKFTKAKDEK